MIQKKRAIRIGVIFN